MPATLDAPPAPAPASPQHDVRGKLSALPTPDGRFGVYGRRFVPETLMAALDELTSEYAKAKADPQFQADLDALLKDYVGRGSRCLRRAG